MKKVRFGIVGIGNMGSTHVKLIDAMNDGEITAVCDINPAAFDRISDDIRQKLVCCTDLDEFLSLDNIDVVVVAVPHYDHPYIAVKAMEHGKHIIVEKPITVHKKAAQALIDESRKYPHLIRALMFCQRTLPAHIKLKQLIDSGELGKITRINWIITDWFRTQHYYDSGDWRASWRGEGGGVLLNQCPHQLDLMQWLFGMPEKVRATAKLGKYHDIEVEDEVNAYLEYADGKVANFIASTGEMPGTNRLEITCTRGRVVLERGKIEFIRNEIPTDTYIKTSDQSFVKSENWVCDVKVQEDKGSQHQRIFQNVADALLRGKELIAPLEDGIRGLELGNAMLLSGLKDKTVTLPIDADEYAEMLGKLVATSRYTKKSVSSGSADDFGSSF
ncbi:MAG: Gfo/Idh/MocA family oxidoreductase [Lentisphaeria bacterium]|nr:Gfo/Idh/MocA family oxidoreductase [Lentisphaeria bacterium]